MILMRLCCLPFWLMAAFVTIIVITTTPAATALFYPSSHNPTIRIINLDRDKERWEKVLRQFQTKTSHNGRHTNTKIQRLPAVSGKALTRTQLQSNATLLARLFCTPGMIGCYLSHRTFWQEVAEGEEPYQIVLEDDALLQCNQGDGGREFVMCVQDAVGALQKALAHKHKQQQTDEAWDVLLLGAFGSNHPAARRGIHDVNAIVMGGSKKTGVVVVPSPTSNHNHLTIHIPRRPFGTHAYVLSKRGAKKLMNQAWYANGHVDCIAWGMQTLNIYSLDPMLVRPDMSAPSTIGTKTTSLSFWERLTSLILPQNLLVDDYSKVTVRWALGEPLVRIPLINTVVTIGATIFYSVVGLILGSLFRRQLPWLLPLQAAMMSIMLVLLRLMGRPVGRQHTVRPQWKNRMYHETL